MYGRMYGRCDNFKKKDKKEEMREIWTRTNEKCNNKKKCFKCNKYKMK